MYKAVKRYNILAHHRVTILLYIYPVYEKGVKILAAAFVAGCSNFVSGATLALTVQGF